MFDIGTVCIKTSGKNKGKKAVVVDIIDQNFVLVDGEFSRARCNVKHLENTGNKVNIDRGADTKTVQSALK